MPKYIDCVGVDIRCDNHVNYNKCLFLERVLQTRSLKRAVCLEPPLQRASQRACFLTAARWSSLRPGGRLALSLAGWRTNGFLLLQLGDGQLTGERRVRLAERWAPAEPVVVKIRREDAVADRLAGGALAVAGWRCRLAAELSSWCERSRVPYRNCSRDWLMLTDASVLEASIFILLSLDGPLTNERSSCCYER
jgi:hypothetical protein